MLFQPERESHVSGGGQRVQDVMTMKHVQVQELLIAGTATATIPSPVASSMVHPPLGHQSVSALDGADEGSQEQVNDRGNNTTVAQQQQRMTKLVAPSNNIDNNGSRKTVLESSSTIVVINGTIPSTTTQAGESKEDAAAGSSSHKHRRDQHRRSQGQSTVVVDNSPPSTSPALHVGASPPLPNNNSHQSHTQVQQQSHHHPRRRQAIELLRRLPVTTNDLFTLLQQRSQATDHRLREVEIQLAQYRTEAMRAKQEMLQWRQAATEYRRERDVTRAEVEQAVQRSTRMQLQIQHVQRQLDLFERTQLQFQQQAQGAGEPGPLTQQAEAEASAAATITTAAATEVPVTTDTTTLGTLDGLPSATTGASPWDGASILRDLQEVLNDHVTQSIDHLVSKKSGRSSDEPIQVPASPHAQQQQSLSLPSTKCHCGCQEEIQAWRARVAKAEEAAEKERLARKMTRIKYQDIGRRWEEWRERVLQAKRDRKKQQMGHPAQQQQQKQDQEQADEHDHDHDEQACAHEIQQERILRKNTDFNRNLSLHHLMPLEQQPPQPQDTEPAVVCYRRSSVEIQTVHPPSRASLLHGGAPTEPMEIDSDTSQDDDQDDLTEETPVLSSPAIHGARRNLGKSRADSIVARQEEEEYLQLDDLQQLPLQYSPTFPSDLALHRRRFGDDDEELGDDKKSLGDDNDDSEAVELHLAPSTTQCADRQEAPHRSYQSTSLSTAVAAAATSSISAQKSRIMTFESDMSSPLFDLERGGGGRLSDVEEIEMIPPPSYPTKASIQNLENRVMGAVQRRRPSTTTEQQKPIQLSDHHQPNETQQKEVAALILSDDHDEDFQRPRTMVKRQRQQQEYLQQRQVRSQNSLKQPQSTPLFMQILSTGGSRRVVVPETPQRANLHKHQQAPPPSSSSPAARQQQPRTVHFANRQQQPLPQEGTSVVQTSDGSSSTSSTRDLSEVDEPGHGVAPASPATAARTTVANNGYPTRLINNANPHQGLGSRAAGLSSSSHAPGQWTVATTSTSTTAVAESSSSSTHPKQQRATAMTTETERIYNFTERRKHKRKQMHAEDCACCRDWYEAVGPLPRPDGYHAFFDPVPPREQEQEEEDEATDQDGARHGPGQGWGRGMISVAQRKKQASRHRVQHRERLTPPGFWTVGFPSETELREWDRVARERAEVRDGKRSRMQ